MGQRIKISLLLNAKRECLEWEREKKSRLSTVSHKRGRATWPYVCTFSFGVRIKKIREREGKGRGRRKGKGEGIV